MAAKKWTGRPGDPDRCERLVALRRILRLTQADVANRSGEPGLDKLDVTKIECGWNAMTLSRHHAAMAAGLGVTAEDLEAVLNGTLKPATAAKRARAT